MLACVYVCACWLFVIINLLLLPYSTPTYSSTMRPLIRVPSVTSTSSTLTQSFVWALIHVLKMCLPSLSCRMRDWRLWTGASRILLPISALRTNSTWSAAGWLTSTTGWKWVHVLNKFGIWLLTHSTFQLFLSKFEGLRVLFFILWRRLYWFCGSMCPVIDLKNQILARTRPNVDIIENLCLLSGLCHGGFCCWGERSRFWQLREGGGSQTVSFHNFIYQRFFCQALSAFRYFVMSFWFI